MRRPLFFFIENELTQPDKFEPGGTIYNDKLRSTICDLKVRREAKLTIESQERAILDKSIPDEPTLVYAPLPTDTPELIPGLLPESGTAAVVDYFTGHNSHIRVNSTYWDRSIYIPIRP